MSIVQWDYVTSRPETTYPEGPPRQHEPFPADGRCPYHGLMLTEVGDPGSGVYVCHSQRAGLKHENGVWPVICDFVARR